MKKFCFTLILASVFGFISAQTGIIKGVITDAISKQTLIGVNVVLEDNTGVASDFNGNYEIKVSSGEHTILYRFIGYKTQNKKVTVAENQTITLNLALEEAVTELNTVVVSAGKFEQKIEDVTVSMSVIKPSLVEDKGSTSIASGVNQTPGVQIVDNEPQIRGGSGYSFGAGSRVMIMVDDLPALSGDAGRPSWSFLPIENLEQIEILKGASSVLYGSAALSGVINIRTAYPKDKPQTKININTGFYDNPQNKEAIYWGNANPTYTGMNFFHSRKIGNLDFVLGGNVLSDQGFIGPDPEKITVNGVKTSEPNKFKQVVIGNDTLLKTRSDTTYQHIQSNVAGGFQKRARMNMNLRYRSKKIEGLNFGVNFNAMYSQSASTFLMLNVEEGMYRSYPGTITQSKSLTYNIDPFVNFYAKNGDKHMLRTRIYTNDNINTNDQSNSSTLYFGEYQLAKGFENIKDFHITFGAMTSYSAGHSKLYRGNEDSSGTNHAMNNAVYVQLDKKFWDRLTVSGGARYERFEVNSTSAAKPIFRFGVSGRALKATFLRASWGQGFRVPTIAEKYVKTQVGALGIYPTPNLEPETSWNSEIGIKQGFKIGEFMGYIDVAGFWQEIQNTVEYTFGKWGPDLFDVGFRSLNIGDATVYGLDASIVGSGKIGEIDITTLLGYTYIHPFIKDQDFAYDTTLLLLVGKNGFPDSTIVPLTYKTSSIDTSGIMKYRFEHMIKGDIQFKYKKFSLGASYRYLSYMKNVDAIFIYLDKDNNNKTYSLYEGQLPTGVRKYRDERKGQGEYVVDMRFSYQANENMKVALIINNLLNREYMIRPLNMEAPRVYALQYTLTF